MKITLKKKRLNSGKFSLYIEYYSGYYIDDRGVKVNNRQFEYLKLYVTPNSD